MKPAILIYIIGEIIIQWVPSNYFENLKFIMR